MVVTAVVTAVDDDDGLVERHRTTDVMRDARARLGASRRLARPRRRAFARTSDATRLAGVARARVRLHASSSMCLGDAIASLVSGTKTFLES